MCYLAEARSMWQDLRDSGEQIFLVRPQKHKILNIEKVNDEMCSDQKRENVIIGLNKYLLKRRGAAGLRMFGDQVNSSNNDRWKLEL